MASEVGLLDQAETEVVMEVHAVVVTYHPGMLRLQKLLSSLVDQVTAVIIVDNSVPATDFKGFDANIVHFGENLGIAAAQNIGMQKAFENSADAVVLFDQDSNPPPDMVPTLVEQSTLLREQLRRPVVIGPSIFCLYEGRLHKPWWQRDHVDGVLGQVLQKQLIASGLLISRSAYETAGPMLEQLFIDAVDHEWCWRAAKKGVAIYQSNKITLEHRMGDARYKVFGVWTKQTSPARLYYQFRNTLWLASVDYVPLYWKLRNIAAIPVKLLLLVCLHPDKVERLQYAFRGLKDGVLHSRRFRRGLLDKGIC